MDDRLTTGAGASSEWCRHCGGPILRLPSAGFWIHLRTGFLDCAARGHGLVAATDADRRAVSAPARWSAPFRLGRRRACPAKPRRPSRLRAALHNAPSIP